MPANPLVIVLLVVIVVLLLGGGYTFTSGRIEGRLPAIVWVLILILLIVWLLQSLGAFAQTPLHLSLGGLYAWQEVS